MGKSFVNAALLEMLVCPVCHQKLEQIGEEADSTPLTTAACAAAGWLRCLGCSRCYPIEDGLAVMLEERATHKPRKDIG